MSKKSKVLEVIRLEYNRFKKSMTNPLFLFRIRTSLKITFIPFLSFSLIFFNMWFFTRINLIFFEAHGYPGAEMLREAYFDFIYGDLVNYFYAMGGSVIALFFFGNYIAGLLIRPFKALAEYCEDAQNNNSAIYSPDLFSDLSLMTRFSEYFFTYLKSQEKSGCLTPEEIPLQFSRVHRPKFERTYFVHFAIFLGFIGLVSSIAIFMLAVDIQSQIVQLSIRILNQSESVSYFLNEQNQLLMSVLWTSICLQMFFYTLLSINLYSGVSGPAFAIFSTMRSFTKGNHGARVHLIGYNFLREHCRTINKYLDHVQRKFNNLDTKSKKAG